MRFIFSDPFPTMFKGFEAMVRILIFLICILSAMRAHGGVDLNTYAAYESANRTYSNDANASSKVRTLGTDYGLNAVFFLSRFPVGLGLQVQSGTAKGSNDDVDHKLTSTKIATSVKFWSPKMKSRLKPFLNVRYLLFNQEKYSQEFDSGSSGFGTITSTYQGTTTGYGVDVGCHFSVNHKFYLYSAISYSTESTPYSKIKTDTQSGGSSDNDVVDNSKLVSAVSSFALGVGVTLGGAKK